MTAQCQDFRLSFGRGELANSPIYRKVDHSASRALPEIRPRSPSKRITLGDAPLPPRQEAPRAYSPNRALSSEQIKQLMLSQRSCASQNQNPRPSAV